MEEVVIVQALRSPIGKYRGALQELTAVELGVHVTEALLKKVPQSASYVEEVIFGNVLQAGNGQNVARQIALNAGLAPEVVAFTVNEVCASGLKAILLGKEAIQLGKAQVVLAGGTESMSQAPLLKYPNGKEVASLFYDGLTDAFSKEAMGLTAERVAEIFHISRKEQDNFALASQKKATLAKDKGKFSPELVPFPFCSVDEGIRPQTTLEKLGQLKPVFKEDGTVTAGNASTINDGASAVLLASKSFAEKMNWPYLAVVKDSVEIGIDPAVMGISPIKTIEKLLQKTKLTVNDIDFFEINEAFAATSLAVEKELGLPQDKVNIYGGGISLGHAIGATGARITTTLAHQLNTYHKRYGIAALCVGGGLGVGLLLERPQKNEGEKFYQWSLEKRQTWLEKEGFLSTASQKELQRHTLSTELLQNLIENPISEVEIPLGLVKDLRLDGKTYQVPLATEEPSVVAACNYGVKMMGEVTSQQGVQLLRGQIVFTQVKQPEALKTTLENLQREILQVAEKSYPSIVKRGGGVKTQEIRLVGSNFLSLDLLVDTKDAMGANLTNTILEGVGGFLAEKLPEEKILLQILANDGQASLTTVSCKIPVDKVGGKEVAEKIAAASLFAKKDAFRAVTHNKGILNGVSGVVLACGNDTRQVEAASHAFASKNGSYQALSQWQVEEDFLVGSLTLPLTLGIVGGGTKVLPKAATALEILQVTSSSELKKIVAAIGLGQNLAALKALVTTGIQAGHMKLQARSLAMSIGAKGEEISYVAEKLRQHLPMNEKKAREFLQAYHMKIQE